jgi:hypothetical protein
MDGILQTPGISGTVIVTSFIDYVRRESSSGNCDYKD